MISKVSLCIDRPIAFNRDLAYLGIGVKGALLLSQAIYWSKRTTNKHGWFYKTRAEWEDETGLSRTEQETARKKLRELGFIQEEKRDIPCKIYFKIDEKAILDALGRVYDRQHSSPTTDKKPPNGPVGGKPANKDATPNSSPQTAHENPESKPIASAETPPDSRQETCNLLLIDTETTPETTLERARATREDLESTELQSPPPSLSSRPALTLVLRNQSQPARQNTTKAEKKPQSSDEAQSYMDQYARKKGLPFCDGEVLYDYYESNGWKQANGNKIVDWKAAARGWVRRQKQFCVKPKATQHKPAGDDWFEESNGRGYSDQKDAKLIP